MESIRHEVLSSLCTKLRIGGWHFIIMDRIQYVLYRVGCHETSYLYNNVIMYFHMEGKTYIAVFHWNGTDACAITIILQLHSNLTLLHHNIQPNLVSKYVYDSGNIECNV